MPSSSTNYQEAPSTCSQLCTCLTTPKFLFTGLGNALFIVFIFLMLSIYGVIILPYGYTDEDFIARLGMIPQSCQMIAGILLSCFLAAASMTWINTVGYLMILMSAGCLACFYYAMQVPENEEYLALAMGMLGISFGPVFIVAYEQAVKTTAHKGVGEAMACGFVNSFGMAASAILQYYLTL
jgi:hypothetical protein